MKKAKNLFLSFLISPLILSANETERVEVGMREITDVASLESNIDKDGEENGELQEAGYILDQYPVYYYSNAHHWLSSVTVLDYDRYTIELEDGSVWKVHSYDGSKILSWRADEPLTITQNHRWFSPHNHKIINKTTGVSVEASLYLGPVVQGPHSKYIVAIDYYRGEILLNDNTTWEISSSDNYLLSRWALNDYVIIGTNSNYRFWDADYDCILINVNVKDNPTVSAKQF